MTKEELQQVGRKTRKLITMYEGLHPKSCVGRVYTARKQDVVKEEVS